MVQKQDELFPNVSNSISVAIFFWIWMFGIIASSEATGLQNAYGAINPTVLFSLGGLGLIGLAFREARTTGELRAALGFKTKIPGLWILSSFNGIGVGILIWIFFTGQLANISGSTAFSTIAQPFYNPYTASATPFLLGSLTNATFGILFINAFVAFFEELYKIGMFKIQADWIYRNSSLGATPSMLISLFATFALWGTWHYFSWPELTIASIVTAVIYGMFFYTAYYVAGLIDIIPVGEIGNPNFTQVLSGVVIYPAIASHWTWNVLVSTSGAGIKTISLLYVGIGFVVLSAIGMYVSRKISG